MTLDGSYTEGPAYPVLASRRAYGPLVVTYWASRRAYGPLVVTYWVWRRDLVRAR